MHALFICVEDDDSNWAADDAADDNNFAWRDPGEAEEEVSFLRCRGENMLPTI